MEQHYTPIDLNQFNSQKKSKDSFTLVLMIIATVTAAILAALLFFLIQKKLQRQASQPIQNTSQTQTQVPSPVATKSIKISPTVMPSPSDSIASSPAIIDNAISKPATNGAQTKKTKVASSEAIITASATPTINK